MSQGSPFSLHLQQMREQYDKGILSENDLHENPMKQFEKWFTVALNNEVPEPNAMCFTSVTNNKPSSRIVLLKGLDERGFVFFTNYQSRKGEEINHNTNVCLNFFWQPLAQQVRIEGEIRKVSAEESDAYFAVRPRESQIGAWASSQSSLISSRKDLEDEVIRLNALYENKIIPRPPHWGGYLVIPNRIEFWQGRPNRLHDRFLYERNNENWMVFRLAP
ncbi:MAG: pyridoxamine 5'-phosphate oxidase [Bacteroidota bacterium]